MLTCYAFEADVEVFINGVSVGAFSDYKAVVWGGTTSVVAGLNCTGLVSSAYGFGTVTVKIHVVITATLASSGAAQASITGVNMNAQGYLLELKV